MNDKHMHPAVKVRLAKKHAKAVKTAQETVASARTACGEAHPAVAAALCGLAMLHQSKSDFDQAVTTLSQALAIREKHPSDTAALVETLRSLARLHDIAGQPEKSRHLMQRATRIEEEVHKAHMRPVESAEAEYDAHAEFVEEMAGSAPKTFWTQVLGGLLLPAGLGFPGLRILLSGRAVFYGQGGSMAMNPLTVTGPVAVMVGLAWLCAAVFFHFHFFWPYRSRTLCAYGKAASLIAGVILLFTAMTVMWRG